MTRRKKKWLGALMAALAAGIAALAPATAPLVEAVAAGIGEVLIGTEERPAVVQRGAPLPDGRSA